MGLQQRDGRAGRPEAHQATWAHVASLVKAYRTAQEEFKAKRWSAAIEAAVYAKELAQGRFHKSPGDRPFSVVPLHVVAMRLEEIIMHSAVQLGSPDGWDEALRAARAISPFYDLMCPPVRCSSLFFLPAGTLFICVFSSCWYAVLPCAYVPVGTLHCHVLMRPLGKVYCNVLMCLLARCTAMCSTWRCRYPSTHFSHTPVNQQTQVQQASTPLHSCACMLT